MSWQNTRTKIVVGRRYGRLVVLNRRPNNKHGGSMFECQCDCGEICTAYGHHLSGGHTTQCGKCGRRPHLDRIHAACRLDPGKAARHATFLQTKRSAVVRGISWNLPEEEFHKISQLPCHYCGDVLSNCKKGKRGIYGEHRYNGIDRVESSKGYEPGNMVPCCWRCNRSKCDMSVKEFVEWSERLYRHQHRS